MKLLLFFLFVVLVLGARGAQQRRAARTWPLIIASMALAGSYFSLRVI